MEFPEFGHLITIIRTLWRLKFINPKSMNNLNPAHSSHPVLQAVKNLFSKLRQNPDVYPIKYYKKGQRFRRNWKTPEVK